MRYFTGSALFLSACLIAASPGDAQAPAGPPRQVSDQAIGDFIDSHAATTRLDKIALWEDGTCLSITGLPPGFAKFVTQRVRQIAAQVGAPVDANEACNSNIDIVFTTKPQALVDNIRAKNPRNLGYYDNSSQLDQLAKVTRPIQAWYITQTMDLHGQPQVDSRDYGSVSHNITGGRLGDGLRSAFFHVLIVADPSKLGDFEIGAISDYIALLALSEPASPEACQELPSITNMTTPGCHTGAAATAITSGDTAYMRALYKTTPGGTLHMQRDEIVSGMKQALGGH